MIFLLCTDYIVIYFVQFGFMLIALIWEFVFSAFMVLIIGILNDGEKMAFTLLYRLLILYVHYLISYGIDCYYLLGTIMTISKDRVKPSPTPDSWKLKEIFATGIVLGGYQAVMSVVFFWAILKTDFFSVSFISSFSFLFFCVKMLEGLCR